MYPFFQIISLLGLILDHTQFSFLFQRSPNANSQAYMVIIHSYCMLSCHPISVTPAFNIIQFLHDSSNLVIPVRFYCVCAATATHDAPKLVLRNTTCKHLSHQQFLFWQICCCFLFFILILTQVLALVLVLQHLHLKKTIYFVWYVIKFQAD